MLSFGWDFVWTIINLIILYLILKKFLIGPVTAVIEKRKEMIDESFAQAKQVKDEAEDIRKKWKHAMAKVEEDAASQMQKTKEKADKEYARIVSQANEHADKIIQEARESIDLEKTQAVKDAEKEIATLAMAAAAKIVGTKSSEMEDLALYNQYIQAGGVNDANSN